MCAVLMLDMLQDTSGCYFLNTNLTHKFTTTYCLRLKHIDEESPFCCWIRIHWHVSPSKVSGYEREAHLITVPILI